MTDVDCWGFISEVTIGLPNGKPYKTRGYVRVVNGTPIGVATPRSRAQLESRSRGLKPVFYRSVSAAATADPRKKQR